MSDNMMQSYRNMDESPEKSKQLHKSGWMSHWMRTSCRAAAPDDQEVVCSSKDRGLLFRQEADSESAKLVKGRKEGTQTKLINFMEESLTPSSKKLRSESVGTRSFPMFSSLRNKESVLVPKNSEASRYHEGVLNSDIGLNSGINVSLGRTQNCLPPMCVQAATGTETQLRESQLRREGITWNGENNLVTSGNLRDNFVSSASETVPYEFKGGTTSIQPFFGIKDHIHQTTVGTCLVPKKRMDNNAGLLMRDPSTSKDPQRDIITKQSQEVKNQAEMQLFPSHINRPDMIKLKKLCHGSYGLPGMSSIHDVESMRIYTTVDSVKGCAGGSPNFSQTTQHFFITKKTEVNLSDGGQVFGELSTPTNFKRKAASELLSLSPDFDFNVKQGVKLQPLDSATESEGKAIINNDKTSTVNLSNGSSADTDTMEMDAFQENHLSGEVLSRLNKDVKKGRKSLAYEASIPSLQQETRGKQCTELPDMNLDLPVFQDMANSEDNEGTSTSRTQSLDVDHFLSHAEYPTNLDTCPDVMLRMDPCSRWVKRLKSSASDSFDHGARSSRMGEASSHEKDNKLFSKVLKCNKTSSELKMGKSCGKENIMIDQTTKLPRNGGSSSSDSERKCQDITLSHAWIQRWCHNQSAIPERKPEASVTCEPQNSKAMPDFQKKQFPSIAAMALMGKAVTFCGPCEFRKKGSSVVWNTKE